MGIENYLTAQIIFYFKTSTRKEKKKWKMGDTFTTEIFSLFEDQM